MTERNVSYGWMDTRNLVMMITAFLRESITVRVFLLTALVVAHNRTQWFP